MPSATLLSVLGFPGWGALHLLLEESSPELLLQGLRPLAEAQQVLPATRLLPLLLECLGHPSPWPPQRPLPPLWGAASTRLGRGRLVCRAGAAVPLRLQMWVPPSPRGLCWRELDLVAGSALAGSSTDLNGLPACDPGHGRTGLGLRQSFGSRR